MTEIVYPGGIFTQLDFNRARHYYRPARVEYRPEDALIPGTKPEVVFSAQMHGVRVEHTEDHLYEKTVHPHFHLLRKYLGLEVRKPFFHERDGYAHSKAERIAERYNHAAYLEVLHEAGEVEVLELDDLGKVHRLTKNK